MIVRTGALACATLWSCATICGAQLCEHVWKAGADKGARTLVVQDLPDGPVLFAGGQFTQIGGVPAKGVARWDGSQWWGFGDLLHPLGAGQANALCIFDDGAGEALYVGGSFESAGGVPATSLARWDGSAWSSPGTLTPQPTWGAGVTTLHVHDDGSGPALYIGGSFLAVDGVSANNIARFDGTRWSALGAGLGVQGPACMATFDDGTGPKLYVGGWFSYAGFVFAPRLARWDGVSWSAIPGGIQLGLDNGLVRALHTFDDGAGPALFVGGCFAGAGGLPNTSGIARWDGRSWSSIGGTDPFRCVLGLQGFDRADGPALYAAGNFNSLGGQPFKALARWDGAAWSGIGEGPTVQAEAGAMTRFDEAGTPTLWITGNKFQTQQGLTNGLVKYQYACPPCLADCDGNGALNIDDFLCFQLKFALADPYADCDGNSLFNIDDFLCFQTAFAVGC